jgi:hypothetical protein
MILASIYNGVDLFQLDGATTRGPSQMAARQERIDAFDHEGSPPTGSSTPVTRSLARVLPLSRL